MAMMMMIPAAFQFRGERMKSLDSEFGFSCIVICQLILDFGVEE